MHLSILQADITLPFRKPNLSTAIRAYRLHEGVNRQPGGSIGDIQRL